MHKSSTPLITPTHAKIKITANGTFDTSASITNTHPNESFPYRLSPNRNHRYRSTSKRKSILSITACILPSKLSTEQEKNILKWWPGRRKGKDSSQNIITTPNQFPSHCLRAPYALFLHNRWHEPSKGVPRALGIWKRIAKIPTFIPLFVSAGVSRVVKARWGTSILDSYYISLIYFSILAFLNRIVRILVRILLEK